MKKTAVAQTEESNGLGNITPTVATITEQINGKYELYLEHQIDEQEKYKRLEVGRLIKCDTYRGEQLFRISAVHTDIPGIIRVYALHIFYDLLDCSSSVRINNAPLLSALMIPFGSADPLPDFTYTVEIGITQRNNINIKERRNLVSILIGNEDYSFSKKWDFEINRNKNIINFLPRLGADNGVEIRYKKNLGKLQLAIDYTTIKTCLEPFALDATGNKLYLSDTYPYNLVISSNSVNYHQWKFGILDCTDIVVGEEINGGIPYPDNASAKIEMAKRANAEFTKGVDKPLFSLNAELIDWQDIDEYKEFASLFELELGDIVTLVYEPLGVNEKNKGNRD